MRNRYTRWARQSIVAIGLFGCIPITEAPYPENTLKVWWMLVEACSGHKADFRQWTFATDEYSGIAPMDRTGNEHEEEEWAVTFLDRHLILLSARGARCPKIVRHEMLHAIDPSYTATHPDSAYQRCKGIVTPAYSDARDC